MKIELEIDPAQILGNKLQYCLHQNKIAVFEYDAIQYTMSSTTDEEKLDFSFKIKENPF